MTNLPDLDLIHKKYQTITQTLIQKKQTITTMESCTSGFIASLITDTEGSSAIFKGSFITYSNEAKILNGVNPQIINQFGVYSIETSKEMAKAAQNKIMSDISIGITGTFGNIDPNNKDSVPGKVFITIIQNNNFISYELNLPLNLTRFQSKIFVADSIANHLF